MMFLQYAAAATPFLLFVVIYFYYRLNKMESYLINRHKFITQKIQEYTDQITDLQLRLDALESGYDEKE